MIDVAPPEQHRAGHVSGAINVPIDELETRLREFDHDKEVIAYCRGPYCVLAFEDVARFRDKGVPARRLHRTASQNGDWRGFQSTARHSASTTRQTIGFPPTYPTPLDAPASAAPMRDGAEPDRLPSKPLEINVLSPACVMSRAEGSTAEARSREQHRRPSTAPSTSKAVRSEGTTPEPG